jgi:glucose/arabinose dehydrogenase
MPHAATRPRLVALVGIGLLALLMAACGGDEPLPDDAAETDNLAAEERDPDGPAGAGAGSSSSRGRSPVCEASASLPSFGAAPGDCSFCDAPADDNRQSATLAPEQVELVPALGGLAWSQPIDLAWLPDGRALVAEQDGLVTLSTADGSQRATALDLRGAVLTAGSEEGLLSLALDPDFAINGHLWLYYSVQPRASRLSRFQFSESAIDRTSELVILEVPQPFSNHNGGAVRFGPDGMLYLGLGDGGSANDPDGNGQNLRTLLGTILRLDVSRSSAQAPYAIPLDNPFRGVVNIRGEIWAYGMRNPWRMAFDAGTGLLWVGDVGQGSYEEVDVTVSGGNYGWNATEGFECFPEGRVCDANRFEPPFLVYGHDLGCAVIGGEVYRGVAIPSLVGAYVFGDLCSGEIWAAASAGSQPAVPLLSTGLAILSFAPDPSGELYVLVADQAIMRIVPTE